MLGSGVSSAQVEHCFPPETPQFRSGSGWRGWPGRAHLALARFSCPAGVGGRAAARVRRGRAALCPGTLVLDAVEHPVPGMYWPEVASKDLRQELVLGARHGG